MGKIYGEIEKFEVMSVEEEAEKIEKAQAGDIAAKEELVNANMRFVAGRANHYAKIYINMTGSRESRCEFINDLISVGGIALYNCIDKFDSERNVRLISFAAQSINGEMVNEMNKQIRTIHIPKNKIALLRKMYKAKKEIKAEKNTEATLEEIAERMAVKSSVVKELEEIGCVAKSLNEEVKQESNYTYEDKQLTKEVDQNSYYDDSVVRRDEAAYIRHCFKQLNEQDQKILKKMFYDEISQTQIADETGVTRQRVGQLKDRALKHLKAIMAAKRPE